MKVSVFHGEDRLGRVHRLYYGYCMFEYQQLPLDRLDQDLIGIVAFHYAGNGLASSD